MKKYRELVGALIVIIIFWWLGSIVIKKSFLPDPAVTIKRMLELIADGTLTRHILISAKRLIAGTLLGSILALPVGLFMGSSQRIDKILKPIFYLLYPIPKIVFLPIIIVTLGIGDFSKVFLIALVLFFQLTVVIRDAARGIETEQIKAMKSLNATKSQQLRHLIIPSCMPGIITSLKTSIGTSMALLFIAETFAAFSGLGYYIANCMDGRKYPEMYSGILMTALLGALFYEIFELMEKRICKWKFIDKK